MPAEPESLPKKSAVEPGLAERGLVERRPESFSLPVDGPLAGTLEMKRVGELSYVPALVTRNARRVLPLRFATHPYNMIAQVQSYASGYIACVVAMRTKVPVSPELDMRTDCVALGPDLEILATGSFPGVVFRTFDQGQMVVRFALGSRAGDRSRFDAKFCGTATFVRNAFVTDFTPTDCVEPGAML